MPEDTRYVKWLIGVETGRLLGDQRYRGTKAKDITSCDKALVTNIVLLPLRCTHAFAQKTSVGPRPCSEAAHRTPPGSSALCESEATATTKRPDGTEINYTFWR